MYRIPHFGNFIHNRNLVLTWGKATCGFTIEYGKIIQYSRFLRDIPLEGGDFLRKIFFSFCLICLFLLAGCHTTEEPQAVDELPPTTAPIEEVPVFSEPSVGDLPSEHPIIVQQESLDLLAEFSDESYPLLPVQAVLRALSYPLAIESQQERVTLTAADPSGRILATLSYEKGTDGKVSDVEYQVGDKTLVLSCPPQYIGDRLYLPFDYYEALGLAVSVQEDGSFTVDIP